MARIDNKKDIKKKKGSNKKVKDKKVEIVNDNKTKEKELYTSKEVIIVMIFSIGIGILMCFGGISIITGKNYLAVTKDLKKVVDTYYAIVDNYYGELDRDRLAYLHYKGYKYTVANMKPVGKVMQNDIKKAAMCGESTIKPKSRFCFCKIKLYETKYKLISSTVLPPPVAAYLYVCSGIKRLKSG